MRNDQKEKNAKKAARLSGALLARKGAASPAQTTLSMHQPVINRFASPQEDPDSLKQAAILLGEEKSEHEPGIHSAAENGAFLANGVEAFNDLADRPQSMVRPVKAGAKKQQVKKIGIGSKGKVSSKNSVPSKSSKDPAVKNRIAMTLRMEAESHLKLRIFSAHTRKSCQEILSEALEFYLEHNSDQIPMQKIAAQTR